MRTEDPFVILGELTEIDSLGVVFSAKVVNQNKDNIESCGFVWGSAPDLAVESSESSFVVPSISNGVFSKRVSTTFKKGSIYWVRAFITIGENIWYSNSTSFVALGSSAPEISGFYPESGHVGDTIVLTGKNFSNISRSNIVLFGIRKSVIISAYQDSLVVKVPQNLSAKSEVSVTILGKTGVSDKLFSLITSI